MHFPGKILFAMDMYNSGNIAGAPSKVEFQYQEYLTGKVLETEQNSNGLDSVAAIRCENGDRRDADLSAAGKLSGLLSDLWS